MDVASYVINIKGAVMITICNTHFFCKQFYLNIFTYLILYTLRIYFTDLEYIIYCSKDHIKTIFKSVRFILLPPETRFNQH